MMLDLTCYGQGSCKICLVVQLPLVIIPKNKIKQNKSKRKKNNGNKSKNRRLVRACDYCGDVQLKNMEIEHLRNILLEGAPYMKKI